MRKRKFRNEGNLTADLFIYSGIGSKLDRYRALPLKKLKEIVDEAVEYQD